MPEPEAKIKKLGIQIMEMNSMAILNIFKVSK